MKFLVLSILISPWLLPRAHAIQVSHRCQIYSVVQHYELATMKFKSAVESESEWFDVTAEPHEIQKDIDLRDASTTIGNAKVWTGTLLKTSEGDLIQAHATFTIEGASGSASLIMSLDSRLAKSAVVLETKTASEILLIPVELKCKRNSILAL